MLYTTLSLGSTYNDYVRGFFPILTGIGEEAVVVTSSPSSFSPPIHAIQCPHDGTHLWHLKRHAIREGLLRSRDVIFMDADHRPYRAYHRRLRPQLAPPISTPGFLTCAGVVSLGSLYPNPIGLLGVGKPRKYLDMASARFGIDWTEVKWWGDHLFAVSDDGNGLGMKFVEFWDEFACWVRDDVRLEGPEFMLALSDGVAMGFAAKACGVLPRVDGPYFEPLRSCFLHLCEGVWRNGDFSTPSPA